MIFRWPRRDRGHLSREELSTYVDGGPGAPSEARVQAHLAACGASCTADLAELRTTVAILRSIAPVEPPRSFALTHEMIADLPDGKPLGSPPQMRDPAHRRGLPVYAPAAAAIAAAVVFALVLVGNLSGAIEQSGATSRDAASATVAVSQAVELESVLEAPAAAGAAGAESAAPVAPAATLAPEVEVVAETESESVIIESAAVAASKVAPEPEIESLVTDEPEDLEAPARAAAVPESPDELAAAPPSLAAEAETFAPLGTPQLLPDSGGDGEAVITQDFEIAEDPVAPQIAAAPEPVADQAPQPVLVEDDDFDLPVWQILLGTGLAAIALALAALAAARRARRI